jgi:hypothetical protein
MKLSRILGLGAITGLLYFHKQRGGQWTIDSLQDTVFALVGRVRERSNVAKERAAKQVVHEVASTLATATATDSPPRR